MNTTSTSSALGRRRSLGLSFKSFIELLNVWAYRVRQRRMLSELDDLVLRDIGLSRADAVRESLKPFWRG